MKKILGLSIAAILIIGLVAGGTVAYFSDTETSEDNTFTAGVIDLEIDPTTGQAVAIDGRLDLKPGETGLMTITLTPTAGSNPMHVWKHIVGITATDRDENGIIEPEQAYYTENGITTGKNDIDRYIHFDMTVDDVEEIPDTEGWLLTKNLDDFEAVAGTGTPGTNQITDYWIYLGILDPNDVEGVESMTVVQSFHLDSMVENWAQSDILTFDEEFFALQIVGGVTADELPGNELPGHAFFTTP